MLTLELLVCRMFPVVVTCRVAGALALSFVASVSAYSYHAQFCVAL